MTESKHKNSESAQEARQDVIDVFDPAVPDYLVLDTDDIVRIFKISGKPDVTQAVGKFRLPPPMDFGGFNGAGRWTVGQIREWFIFKGRVQNELGKRNYLTQLRNGNIVNRHKQYVSRQAVEEAAASLGVKL